MKLIEVKQNTPEWIELRRTHIGASDCASIMGQFGQRGLEQVLDFKMTGKEPYVNQAMRRGSALESKALAWYNFHADHQYIFCSQVVQSEAHCWQIASLDGYCPDCPWHLEIKCPGEKVMKDLNAGKIPKYWTWQLQHQLAVTGGEKALLLAYNELSQLSLWVHKDQSMITQLVEAEAAFYKQMTWQV